ncbi:heme ABC transporter ATP-binding protein, partial [Salmonella sp. hn-f5]|nr:heme ABC transporter ATP-binding protein [Salmonella sp. hn-f5]
MSNPVSGPIPSPKNLIALELKGITKRYPLVLANDRISLDLRWGEVLAIVGENGAGK